MHINQNEMRYEDDIQIWTRSYIRSTKQVGDFKLWNWAKWSSCLNVYVAHTPRKKIADQN